MRDVNTLQTDGDLLSLSRLLTELERSEVRESLTAFSKWVHPEEPPQPHHALFIAAFERAAAGGREIVMAPPGSAKSEYCTKRGPAWYVGTHPRKRVICASHTDHLAESFGRRVRNMVGAAEYAEAIGASVSKDNSAVGNWSASNGTEFFATGVNKAIAGKRADLVIIDDPYPTLADAMSENYRKRVWDWWNNDVWPRLKPTAGVLLIQTRWHVDDLAGMLIAEGSEQWRQTILRFEAEDDDPLGRKPGELLWPEYFTPEMLRVARTKLGFPSLYQQRPTIDKGGYFQRNWLKWYEKTPKLMTIYGTSDYAVKEDGDYTVHMVFGVDAEDDLYVLDCWRGREQSDKWVDALLDLVRIWKPIEWAEEKGQIEGGVGPFLDKRMSETKTNFYRRGFGSSRDKPTRAQSIRGRLAQGKVWFPQGKPWVSDLVNEMMDFPLEGRNDDMVDCLSLMGRLLDDTRLPRPAKTEAKPKWPLQQTINELIAANRRSRLRSQADA